MGLNFVGTSEPTNPEEGQAWYDSTNNFIRWYDGANWNCIAVFIGSAAPGTPVEGNVWFDTTNHFLKCYDGSNWVCFGTFVGSAAPGTPLEGLVMYDSANDHCKAYDGTNWSNLMTYVGTAAVGTPIEGLIMYDITNDHCKAYDGSAWSSLMTYVGNAAVGTPVEGLFMWDADGDFAQVYNGGSWEKFMTNATGDIGQAELRTDTEEETTDQAENTWVNYTFSSVSSYGFYPQIKFEAGTEDAQVQIFYTDDGPTSYTTTIAIFHNSTAPPGEEEKNVYAQIRYVTASGEICWLFILKDKKTGKYLRMHKSPDHPAICCHDVEKVHHPFNHCFDKEKHNILCIPLNKKERKEVEDLREWENEIPGLTFLEVIQKYFDIDENPKDAKWPDIPVTIGVDRNRKVMKTKIPKRKYIKQAALVRKS